MKKTFVLSLIVFWIGATAILAYGFASYAEKKKNANKEIHDTTASVEIEQVDPLPEELETIPIPTSADISSNPVDDSVFNGLYEDEEYEEDDEWEDDEEYEDDEWEEEDDDD
ncbi:MAG: hypothetical protein H6779_00960 [Candidatus Nomurabacteria bacterium]|nr:hypothetical protein [Candidatus Nomurabacteria bacterium]USN88000.1 MAG: hypothetical protein H6779_00960 [Candidatus Nomurabacteria bacterium]